MEKLKLIGFIIFLVFLFFLVITGGAGAFSKKKASNDIKKYLKSVYKLLILIICVGAVLVLFTS